MASLAGQLRQFVVGQAKCRPWRHRGAVVLYVHSLLALATFEARGVAACGGIARVDVGHHWSPHLMLNPILKCLLWNPIRLAIELHPGGYIRCRPLLQATPYDCKTPCGISVSGCQSI
jgi:hypothetical protein